MIRIYVDNYSDIPKEYLNSDIVIVPNDMLLSEKYELLEQEIKQGNQIIFLCTSSAISDVFINTRILKEKIIKEYKNVKIEVIDSQTVSLAEGLIVLKANKMIREGKSFEEIVNYIENYKKYYKISLFGDNFEHQNKDSVLLDFLYIFSNKHLFQIDNNNGFVNIMNSRGIKRCDDIILTKLVEEVDESSMIGIVYFNNYKSARRLENRIDDFDFSKEIIVNEISPDLGIHIGSEVYGVAYKTKIKTRE